MKKPTLNKPTLLMDCDGVLADFTNAALALIWQVTGRQYEASQVTTWEVFDSIPEPAARREVYGLLKGMGGCSSIPVYDGAKEAFTKLQELANIVVVTSPFTGSFTWAYERERWLERHFGVSYRDVIHAHEKYRIHGDIFLDDKPEHVDAWLDYWVNSGRDENVTALLWETDRTINATVSSMAERVKDWESVLEIVRGYYKYASKSRKMAE